MKKLIFATNNLGKVDEIRQILPADEYEVLSMKDLHLSIDIEENGKTFTENALIKAKTVMEATGEMVLADDSGFEVDYLNKEPGIYSARYLGEDTSYDVKNQALLDRAKDAKGDERTARFVCAIACAFPDGRTITTLGVVEGMLADAPRGEHGFGYDPIFLLPERGVTTAELLPEEKNKISHRGIALRKMVEELKGLD